MEPRSNEEDAYSVVVKAARAFKYSAAELYVRRLLSRIGVAKADLNESHFTQLCIAALEMRPEEASKEGCDAFIATLRQLAKKTGESAGAPRPVTVCPSCKASSQLGKFCSQCGARLS